MMGLKTAALFGGLAMAAMGSPAPAVAAPLPIAGAIATVDAGAARVGGAVERVGYRHRAGRSAVRSAGRWRGYRRARGRTVVIERPCSTRVIRKTRRGRVVRVIEHCRRPHGGRYWRR